MDNREFQQKQIDEVISLLPQKGRVLMQLPTGGGKTVEFSMIADRYLKKFDKSVLIVVHRKELLNQAAATIRKVCGINPAIISAGIKTRIISKIYIAMVDSLTSRLRLISDIGLVIIDECHIANFNKLFEPFIDHWIIGASATPVAASKKHTLNQFYNAIVPGPQISELIDNGFLAQNVTRCPKDIVDTSKFEIDPKNMDFRESQMAREYGSTKYVLNTVRNYQKYCKGKKTLIFNVNKEHSKTVQMCFESFGYNAKSLDSDDKDRDEIIQWFRDTPGAILNNVMITTVGFDEPSVECIILNFSTTSIVKFIQTCGRGSRIYPNKKTFNIIDMGGNWNRFGDWNNDRDWKYIFENTNPRTPGTGAAPVKTCPQCEGLLHASVRVCPLLLEDGSVCGYEFSTKEKNEGDIGEMIIVTRNMVQTSMDMSAMSEAEMTKSAAMNFTEFLDLGTGVVGELLEKYNDPTEVQKTIAFAKYYEMCTHFYKSIGAKDTIKNNKWYINRAKINFNQELRKQLAEKNKSIMQKIN